MEQSTKRLTYPAPRKCSDRTENGFCTHPWTKDDVNYAMSAGAWFQKGSHIFDSQSTAEYAYEQSGYTTFRPHVQVQPVKSNTSTDRTLKLLSSLTPDERAALLELFGE